MSTQPRSTTVPHFPELPVLTATELRKLADWAHSIREGDMCMVVRQTESGPTIEAMPRSAADQLLGTFLMIPVHTENRVKDRKKIGNLGVKLAPRDKKDDPYEDLFKICKDKYGDHPDAMFWTESSVEKFLVPYYASVYSADNALPGRMEDIEKVFDGRFEEVGAAWAEGAQVQVYAMLHLPKSEYVASPPQTGLPALAVAYTISGSGTAGAEPVPELRVARLEALRITG